MKGEKMAVSKQNNKTTRKRPLKPFTGVEGVTFDKDYQPSPEAKKLGWQKWREERHLTQGIIKELQGEKMGVYIKKLIDLAKDGNAKAIDAINKCLEDDITKSEVTINGFMDFLKGTSNDNE